MTVEGPVPHPPPAVRTATIAEVQALATASVRSSLLADDEMRIEGTPAPEWGDEFGPGMNVDQAIKDSDLKDKLFMIMQIHDELVFECLEQDVSQTSNIIQTEMEHALELDVPLKVEVGVGNNWEEAHG